MRDSLEYCPHCNSCLQGKEIPKEQQEFYQATHWGRKIGVYDIELDRTVKWMCPDCKGEWDRT